MQISNFYILKDLTDIINQSCKKSLFFMWSLFKSLLDVYNINNHPVDKTMEIVNCDNVSCLKLYDNNGNLTDKGKEFYTLGKITLSQNKFGVVILSGGQGTRLGCDGPKGLYKICGRSLFEHHITKILETGYSHMIKLFIMTSENTHEDVLSYFKSNKDFGLDVEFFKQNSLPCTYKDGEIIKLDDHNIVTAPNGNGDIFKSINNLDLSDIYAINVISVDNVIAEILNPEFIGAFIDKKLDILSKSVVKHPNENVGIFIKNNGKLEVKEYSELKSDNTSLCEVECEGNICNHLFKTEFVKSMKNKSLPLHKAYKKIPEDVLSRIDRQDETICVKIECFIFDCFQYTEKNMILSVPREREFAPLKNSMESNTDNSKTCADAFRKKSEGLQNK